MIAHGSPPAPRCPPHEYHHAVNPWRGLWRCEKCGVEITDVEMDADKDATLEPEVRLDAALARIEAVASSRSRLLAHIRVATAALMQFGQHGRQCAVTPPRGPNEPQRDCDCGLTDALLRLRDAAKEGEGK